MKLMSKKRLLIFVVLFFVVLFTVSIWPATQKLTAFKIGEEGKTETTGVIIESSRPGPTVVLIAGIHGNEPSGTVALDSLKDLKIQKGKVVILPRGNLPASLVNKRTIPSLGDLNRAFPGQDKGMAVEELAWHITEMIENNAADIVVDLHESKNYKSGAVYAVGHSIIYNDLLIAPLVDRALDHLNSDELEAYVYFCDEKRGTLNTEISNRGIPVVTLEVDVAKSRKERVADHLAFVKYVLKTYDVIE